MLARAANAYRKVDLESAPRTQIVDRLFERFLADVANAHAAITARDVPQKAVMIDHAIQIVTELAASLDHKAAPELCANLKALYDFVTLQLTTASLTLTTAPLADCVRVMTELAEAFRSAHQQSAAQQVER
jgi:flagellar protein FliS